MPIAFARGIGLKEALFAASVTLAIVLFAGLAPCRRRQAAARRGAGHRPVRLRAHARKLTNPDQRCARHRGDARRASASRPTSSNDRDARKLRRDLEGFVEDAEGADVAIIYYSGHGIEAGGENFLVPVDADVSSLDDAGEKLVPLSKIVAELKATVPVTIVLLDACRNDPFPPGAMREALARR